MAAPKIAAILDAAADARRETRDLARCAARVWRSAEDRGDLARCHIQLLLLDGEELAHRQTVLPF